MAIGFVDRLKAGEVLVADGATGTNYAGGEDVADGGDASRGRGHGDHIELRSREVPSGFQDVDTVRLG